MKRKEIQWGTAPTVAGPMGEAEANRQVELMLGELRRELSTMQAAWKNAPECSQLSGSLRMLATQLRSLELLTAALGRLRYSTTACRRDVTLLANLSSTKQSASSASSMKMRQLRLDEL